jgi:outer membrane protein TolC
MDSVQRLIIVFWISGFWTVVSPISWIGLPSLWSKGASPTAWRHRPHHQRIGSGGGPLTMKNWMPLFRRRWSITSILQGLARLDQADALTRQSRAARLPQVTSRQVPLRDWAGDDTRNRLSRVGGALAWEVDVFNRLGSVALASRSEQAARLEDVEAIRLSLSAEVADAYFDAVEQRNQLALLKQQIKIDRDLLELTELRFNAGLTASVDVLQQSSQLAETESLVPPTEALLRVSENRLDVLIGQAPDAVDRVADDDAFIAIGDLPFVGVPSDLLLNRPDLRAFKTNSSQRMPKLDRPLPSACRGSRWMGLFFTKRFGIYRTAGTLLGSLVQPLLDWGARKAEVERSRALYVERLASVFPGLSGGHRKC